MRKFLFIGVGGSGGATLRFIRKSISDRLAEVGYDGPFPAAWQFVQLDLPGADDRRGVGLPPMLGASYHALAPEGVEYDQHRRQLAKSSEGAASEAINELCAWWPDPSEAPRAVWHGAGQYRAVGRVVTLNRLPQIADAIRSALAAMTVETADLQLRDACSYLGFDSTGERDADLAFVIGSMAGGSGAGGVLDVCDLLRGMASHGNSFLSVPAAVLYTADIFRGLGDKVPGAEPNSLAVISELSAAMKRGSDANWGNPYLTAAGLACPAGELGPAITFLIGAGNNDVALPDPISVYKATSLALSTWVTDPKANSGLGATIVGNAFTLRKNESKLSTHRFERPDQACSSFGYARLEVSRNRFRRYCSERLARGAFEVLLRGRLDIGSGTPHAEAVNERLNPQIETDFLRMCGISERDEKENDIIDAIRAEAERASIGSESAGSLKDACMAAGIELTARVLDAPGAGGRNFDLGGAQRKMQAQAEAKATEFGSAWSGLIQVGVERWCADIQQRTVDGVTQSLATEGLAVTVALLQRAATDLDTAMGHLQGESTTISNGGRNAFGHMEQFAGKGAKGANTQLREAFSSAAARRLFAEVEVTLRARAIDAIAEFKTSFLRPLTDALAAAERGLQESWPAVQEWAADDLVPRRFHPDPNVVLLQDVDQYPAQFETLLVKTVGGTKSSAQRLAAERVVAFGSADEVEGDAVTPIISFSKWDRSGGRPASFTIDLDPAAMKERASHWLVSDAAGGIGAYITAPLQETLAGAGQKEIDQFVTRFRVALDRAAPLIDINAATASAVHGSSPVIDPVVSAIPLAPSPGSPLYEGIKNLLMDRKFGFDEARVNSLFSSGDDDAPSTITDIAIFMVLRAHHPMIFGSLVNPIATAALQASNEGDRTFWGMRRARPLAQFVPLQKQAIHMLVRGWFIGQLLGQVVFRDGSWFGRPYKYAEVLVPGRPNGEFPTPGLGALAATPGEVLPVVLESYGLAEAMFATGHAQALAGYDRLLDLGAGDTLTRWIRTGEVDVGTPPVAEDVEARAALVDDLMTRALDSIAEIGRGFSPDTEIWSLPPRTWEIADLMRSAAEEIKHDALSGKTSAAQDQNAIHIG